MDWEREKEDPEVAELSALREENARLTAERDDAFQAKHERDRRIGELMAEVGYLTRERDDARAEAKDWRRVAGLRPAALDAKLAEVARLEGLILDWSNGVNFGGDALDEEARRIRAQREEEPIR